MLKNILIKSVLVILVFVLGLWVFLYVSLINDEHEYSVLDDEQMAQAKSYLWGKFHPVPAGWQWQDFETSNKVTLRTGRADAERAKGTVIFVPGFTGTIEMAMDIIGDIHAQGFNVAAVEYRGQGGSYRPLNHPEKGYVESYEVLADEVAEFAEKQRDPNLPLYFFSVSKGAHITMRMAVENSIDVDGYALVVPMIKINPEPFSYNFVSGLASLLNIVGLGEMYAPGQSQWPPKDLQFNTPHPCNANPKTAQHQSALFAMRPELRAHGSTVKWIYETTRSSELLLSKP